MEKEVEIKVLVVLVFLLLLFNYNFLDSLLVKYLGEKESVFVKRIIDGDTIETSTGERIRFLGMNTPETKEKYSKLGKEFLTETILNKTVELEYGPEKTDRYGRTLAYIFLKGKNINLEEVKKGYANFYFPSGKTKYYDLFKAAWEKCVFLKEGICEESEDRCSKCIKLESFNSKKEEIVFHNECSFSCDLTSWDIKDEGRKHFLFPNFSLNSNSKVLIKVAKGKNSVETLFWNRKSYVWTNTGDTMFLRDSKGKLVLYYTY